ncbi:MAG: hypothetical protein PVJ07_05015 [Anaerolineales bacterium]|jgi:predicted membrane-bound spermidine synthase
MAIEHTSRSGSRSFILPGLGLISASALAFEISLSRLFAIQQFHHFAFMVVSLAVMGIAASGTLIARRRRQPNLAVIAVLYAVSLALAYLTLNYLPFDSYSIAWDRRQVGVLLLYFLAAGTPFLFAGWAVGACLAQAGPQAHRPYAANLAGSALGCLAALAAQPLLGGEGAFAFAIALGWLSAAAFSCSRTRQLTLLAAAIISLLLGVFPPEALALRLSPYKPLSVVRLAPDAEDALTLWGATARVDVVESQTIHIFQGLSLNAMVDLPEQAALFVDGEGPIPISALDPDSSQAETIAQYLPASLAYQLRPGAKALILQPGAGLDVIMALASGTSRVALSNPEPLIPEVLSGTYADYAHHLLDHPKLTLIDRGDRGALRASAERFDIIQFSLSDPFRPVTSGAFSLTEDYTLTIESLRDAYQHLSSDGLLVLTRWLGTPPSESARAWATLLATLESEGIDNPAPRLIAYRGMRTATMIAGSRDFTSDELETVRRFLERNGLDPIVMPGLEPSELNRFNRLPEDTYHQLFTDLLEDRGATVSAYDFNLRPPTDERPFFFHFFRWRQTPEVLTTLGLRWQPFGGSGYLVLLVLLGLVTVFAILLALVPLILLRRKSIRPRPRAASLGYFAFLGAAYLLVEIPLIQRLTLLLDHPALALAAVLFILLLASGVGSLLSPRIPLRRSLGLLVLLLLLIGALLPAVARSAAAWGLPARLALAAALLAPPGVLMGIPFAAGLRRLETHSPGQIPWAWALNGGASGVSGVLAALLALDLGITATFMLGALAYFGAWILAKQLP